MTRSRWRHVEHCMGTVFSLDLPGDLDPAALAAALAWLHRMDAVFSTYRADSDISRLDRGEIALADCAGEVGPILALCESLRESTDGYFDAYAGGRLDPSGLVKGWAIEGLHQRLIEAGSRRHHVNGGGDIRCTAAETDPPWRFGIADPLRPCQLAAVVAGTDFALATSGTAERGQHILDPHTGQAPRGLASICLIGASMTMTDALATAAFARGLDAQSWVAGLDGVEAYATTEDGGHWATAGFPFA
ncbi:MAG TPA: FAD:protein FMN transferase [Candidatus Acidoferrum sp.]|nr:FAD:protein FMN transferase [Candidatus Acidoferrum sp.]